MWDLSQLAVAAGLPCPRALTAPFVGTSIVGFSLAEITNGNGTVAATGLAAH